MQARGRKGHLLLDYETTFGNTPAVPAAIKMPFQTSEVKSTQNLNDDETIRDNRSPAIPSRGNISVEGQIVVPVDKVAMGYWLRAMFGTPVTSGTGPYTHVFKLGDVHPSLTLEQGFNDINVYELFNGCKVSSFSIEKGGEGDVTASIDIMGANETIGSTSFDEAPTEITLTKFNQFQASIEEGGVSIATVNTATLEIDFDLDGDQYVIGSNGLRADIPEGIARISGTLTALFENTTLLNKAVNGVESSLKLKLTGGADSLEFFLPEVMYERNSPGINGPRGVLIELPYRAYYRTNVEATAIMATLINDQAAY